MPKHAPPTLLILLALGMAPVSAQQPAPPGLLVPREIRPGEIAPDPGITVPERIIPAPPGHGAEVPMPPAASEEAVVPRGGGDPGILVPPPDRKAAPPAARPSPH